MNSPSAVKFVIKWTNYWANWLVIYSKYLSNNLGVWWNIRPYLENSPNFQRISDRLAWRLQTQRYRMRLDRDDAGVQQQMALLRKTHEVELKDKKDLVDHLESVVRVLEQENSRLYTLHRGCQSHYISHDYWANFDRMSILMAAIERHFGRLYFFSFF